MAKLSPEERADVNRRNASRSTGPRSARGKQIVSQNAYKHGLRAETLALPTEDAEAYRLLHGEWYDFFQPRSPGKRALLDRAVYSTIQLQRGAKFQTALLTEQVNAAEVAWEMHREAAVRADVARLADDPAEAVIALKGTAGGCRWLIGEWGRLKDVLDLDGCWYATSHRDRAMRLQGLEPNDLASEGVFWFALLNQFAYPDPGDRSVAWYRDPRNIPDTLQRPLGKGYPTRERCMELLRATVEEELALLTAREERLRMMIEEPSRAGAAARALLLSGEDGALLIRYERMHDAAFHRAYKALLKDEGPGEEGTYDEAEWTAEAVGAEAPNKANPAPAEAPNKANFEVPRPSRPISIPVGPSGDITAMAALAKAMPGYEAKMPVPRFPKPYDGGISVEGPGATGGREPGEVRSDPWPGREPA